MNRLTHIVLLCTLTYSTTASPKSLIPRLDRLRNKVDQALEQDNHYSLKDLLKKTKANNQTIDSRQLILKALNATNTESNDSQEAQFDNIMTEIGELTWSNSAVFIDQFTQSLDENNGQALSLLKEEIDENYSLAKVPLVAFIAALHQEELVLNSSTTKLMKLIAVRNLSQKKKPDSAMLQKGLDKIMICKTNLHALMLYIERLLLGNH